MIVSIKNYVHLISYLKVRDLARSWGFALQETLLDAVFGSSEIKEVAYNVEVNFSASIQFAVTVKRVDPRNRFYGYVTNMHKYSRTW